MIFNILEIKVLGFRVWFYQFFYLVYLFIFSGLVVYSAVNLSPSPYNNQKLLINEISTRIVDEKGVHEEVELFNNSDSEINLTGYYFKDLVGTRRNILDSNSKIFNKFGEDVTTEYFVNQNLILPSGFYLLFETNNGWLNDSSDQEAIYLLNQSDEIIDGIDFSQSDYPRSNQSLARVVDGSLNFELRDAINLTFGFSNNLDNEENEESEENLGNEDDDSENLNNETEVEENIFKETQGSKEVEEDENLNIELSLVRTGGADIEI